MVAKSTDGLRLITTAGTIAELQENNSNVTFKKQWIPKTLLEKVIHANDLAVKVNISLPKLIM